MNAANDVSGGLASRLVLLHKFLMILPGGE